MKNKHLCGTTTQQHHTHVAPVGREHDKVTLIHARCPRPSACRRRRHQSIAARRRRAGTRARCEGSFAPHCGHTAHALHNALGPATAPRHDPRAALVAHHGAATPAVVPAAAPSEDRGARGCMRRTTSQTPTAIRADRDANGCCPLLLVVGVVGHRVAECAAHSHASGVPLDSSSDRRGSAPASATARTLPGLLAIAWRVPTPQRHDVRAVRRAPRRARAHRQLLLLQQLSPKGPRPTRAGT